MSLLYYQGPCPRKAPLTVPDRQTYAPFLALTSSILKNDGSQVLSTLVLCPGPSYAHTNIITHLYKTPAYWLHGCADKETGLRGV